MSVKGARRQEFADTFMHLVTETPCNHRVSVVDITNAIGCERKTFYYYFENVDNLVIWIFRSAFKKIIETQFAEYPQVKPHPELQDPYDDWPFYVRIETEDRFLAQGPYFKAITYHWVDNRVYYANMFRTDANSYNNLFEYLVNLYVPTIKDDILFMLGKYGPQSQREIADKICLTPPSVTVAVQKLEQSGLTVKRPLEEIASQIEAALADVLGSAEE